MLGVNCFVEIATVLAAHRQEVFFQGVKLFFLKTFSGVFEVFKVLKFFRVEGSMQADLCLTLVSAPNPFLRQISGG